MGERLRDAGKLSSDDLSKVVEAQRTSELPFGEIAIQMGLITSADVQKALAAQYEYPILDPRDSSLSLDLVTAYDPFGAQAEAVRNLRSQLMLRWFSDHQSTIAITTARSGDGASWLAANLAISFAQLGERTALIDANMRRPMQKQLFGIQPRIGLSEFLSGRASIKESFTAVEGIDKLSVLCAGSVPLNPQELLSRTAFSYLVESSPATFDIVIIDTPAVSDFADAQIAAARARGYLLATHVNETRMAEIKKARSALEASGSVFVGAVVQA
jgi:chain length determinant protein tyrosine kinase EpsG